MLSVRATDASGQQALDEIKPLEISIMNALCGWSTDDETGVFELVRSGMVKFEQTVMRWQLDFKITDQLRTFP